MYLRNNMDKEYLGHIMSCRVAGTEREIILLIILRYFMDMALMFW